MSALKSQLLRAIVVLACGGILPAACGDGVPAECATDADCAAGEVCEPGLGGGTNECVQGCHLDSQCAAGERCQLVVCVTTPCPGQCVATDACATDRDCPSGAVCEPSGPGCGPLACVSGCRDDSQCAAGEVCNVVQCVTCPCPGFCGVP